MGRRLIRKIYFAGPYDAKALEEFLEEQAQNGLMFVKQKGIFYYFEKCEPKKVHFTVDVFEKASIFDTRPEAKTQEYIEYCEECGWKFIFSNGKVQFFYSEEENPVDIQTDDQLKLKIIHKYTLLTLGPSWLCFLNFLFMMISSYSFRQLTGANMVDQFIVFGTSFPIVIAYIGVVVCVSMEIIRYILFYVKNKKGLKSGQKLQYTEKKTLEKYYKFVCTLYVSIFVLLLISLCSFESMGYLFIILILLSSVLIYFVENFRQGNQKISRQNNIIITIVASVVGIAISIVGFTFILFMGLFDFDSQKVKYYDEEEKCYAYMIISNDEIPLTMGELGIVTDGVEYNQTGAYNYASIFGKYYLYDQSYYDKNLQDIGPMLSYEILHSGWKKLLDSYINDYLDQSYYKCTDVTKEEGSLWGSKKVYSVWNLEEKTETRLVVYDKKVISISCDGMEYNENTISIINRALDETD